MGASSGQKCTLKRGDGATPTEAFATIGRIKSWTGPSASAPQIDVSSVDSDAREYIPGLEDSGEVSFDFFFDASNAMQTGIRTDMESRLARNFKLELNDKPTGGTSNTIITFSGIFTKFDIKGGVNAAVEGSAAIKISGKPTWTMAT